MTRDAWEAVPAIHSAKRCGVQWATWMGDWFTSWSPRNDNNNAEGSWDHWVDLALTILSDPMTEIVRPAAFIEGGLEAAGVQGFYDESRRLLTDAELAARFPDGAS